MADEKKRPALAMFVGLSKAKGEEKKPDDEAEEGEEDAPSGKDSAIDDLLAAIQENDRRAARKALESFVGMCRGGDKGDQYKD